jgi:phosphoribosylformimino-5-aminoimidazole carboxamide ribotide isomerase
MMQGVNVEATAAVARAISIPVIASGGISHLDDLRALCKVQEEGIMGAIIGRALYEGDIDLAAAQTLVNSLN